MAAQQIKDLVLSDIVKQAGLAPGSIEPESISGGSINQSFRLRLKPGTSYFLKINSAQAYPGMLEKEKRCLEYLSQQQCLLTPGVIGCGEIHTFQWLLLEWIETGTKDSRFWRIFGEQLAHMHQTSSRQYGFSEDNYIGSLPQVNTFAFNWADFFITCRLQPQFQLAQRKGLLDKSHAILFDKLVDRLPQWFEEEKPSLLHGDLWSGNFMCDYSSRPVLIDPALYFGHRSMDLAMTTLFGGFDPSFYESYHYHFPFPANYEEQWQLCNMYPLLVHLNLFGTGYLPDVDRLFKKFS